MGFEWIGPIDRVFGHMNVRLVGLKILFLCVPDGTAKVPASNRRRRCRYRARRQNPRHPP